MRLLTLGLVASLSFAFQSLAESATIGQWNLDETSGRIAHDSSGNGHDGSLYGPENWEHPGFAFNGIDNYLQIPDSPELTLSTFSATADVYRVDGRYLTILSKGITGAGGTNNYEFNIQPDGKLDFEFYNGGWNVDSRFSNGSISSGTWHTVRADYDGHSVNYWIDGVLDSSFTETTPMLGNNGPLYIGLKLSSGPADYSSGMIRNVTLSTVPEPSALLLLGIGATLLIYAWHRRVAG
jgi:hypothetical protein